MTPWLLTVVVATVGAGGNMSVDDRDIPPGSELDLAIERALEGANLRAGGSEGSSAAVSLEDWEPPAVEAGGAIGAIDGD